MHRHHKVPRHMGGSDDPSNIELVTIEEHADRHRVLYEEHGCWQDYVAWKALSGQITKAEATRLAQVATGKASRGRKHSPEAVETRRQKHLGRKNTPETLEKMKESARRRWGPPREKTFIKSEETRRRMSEARAKYWERKRMNSS